MIFFLTQRSDKIFTMLIYIYMTLSSTDDETAAEFLQCWYIWHFFQQWWVLWATSVTIAYQPIYTNCSKSHMTVRCVLTHMDDIWRDANPTRAQAGCSRSFWHVWRTCWSSIKISKLISKRTLFIIYQICCFKNWLNMAYFSPILVSFWSQIQQDWWSDVKILQGSTSGFVIWQVSDR